jgi:hypothetical protein
MGFQAQPRRRGDWASVFLFSLQYQFVVLFFLALVRELIGRGTQLLMDLRVSIFMSPEVQLGGCPPSLRLFLAI